MDINAEIEKLKNLPLRARARYKPKSEKGKCTLCFLAFVTIGIIYGACSPSKEFVGIDSNSFHAIYEYPKDSIYNSLSPSEGFFLFLIVGLGVTFVMAVTYGKRWGEYNEVIYNAKEELKKMNKIERQEKQKEKEALFKSTIDNLVEKYGTPDSQFCINDKFSIESYIIPFSAARKIMLLGTEMNFSDIIDVQLADDKQVTKGEIKAVTTSDNGSVVGRAVVGGLVAGGVGAVIGGMTGEQTTKFKQANDIITHKYTVWVTTKNIANPSIRIYLSNNERLASKIVATLKAVMAY